jgi:1,4-alpha-glucan branching enzyme
VPGVSHRPVARPPQGELAIVLHTHMPYVEGFGTWPFGEEWLWEALATCYLPLVELLEGGAPLTVSLTPVLCDQLEAPGVGERFARFVSDTRRYTHAEDARGLRAGGHETLAREVERAWGDYERALESFERRGGDLLGAFAPYAQWTSSATHAVLPLLATEAGLRTQVQSGVESHRARFGAGWRGGFWLPECAHASYLEPTLAEAGVHATCVELTGRLGLGAPAHLRPLRGAAGVVLVPVDRATVALVWSEAGYPAHGHYRDYHRHTVHHHQPWANDGGAYDHARALALARAHAADFVARTGERLRRDGAGLPGGGLVVCALDTELLGHWWYEGLAWLTAVVQECARQGLPLVRLDDALERHEPAPVEDEEEWGATTWGQGGDLSTWSGPAVADLAFATRAAELDVVRAGPRAGAAAVRELLALQASDWAFMVSRGLAVPYARERFAAHRLGVEQALAARPDADASAVRNLAVHAHRAALLAP